MLSFSAASRNLRAGEPCVHAKRFQTAFTGMVSTTFAKIPGGGGVFVFYLIAGTPESRFYIGTGRLVGFLTKH